MNLRSEIIAWALAVTVLICILILTVTGHLVAPELWAVLTLATGGALGLSSPGAAPPSANQVLKSLAPPPSSDVSTTSN